MASDYVTRAGDALDLICLRHYGHQAGAVEQVLEANPEIRATAHRLKLGTVITLPALAASDIGQQPARLWD